MSAIIHVIAKRWERGWDLILDEDNVTSVTDLDNAEQQVRDYLGTIEPNVDHSGTAVSIKVSPEQELYTQRAATAKQEFAKEQN